MTHLVKVRIKVGAADAYLQGGAGRSWKFRSRVADFLRAREGQEYDLRPNYQDGAVVSYQFDADWNILPEDVEVLASWQDGVEKA